MSNISLGGQSFSADQVIAAIAASNDACNDPPALGDITTEQLYQVIQGIAYRVDAIEDRLPITRAGFGVVRTPLAAGTNFRFQMLDEKGRTIIVNFEVPNS